MDAGVKRKRGRPAAVVATQSEPEVRVSKRKRFEPLNPSAAEPAAEVEGNLLHNSPSRKRRRGRHFNASVAEQTQDEEPSTARVTRKERVNYAEKRKYSAASQKNVEEPRASREKKRVAGKQEDIREIISRASLKKSHQNDEDRSKHTEQEAQQVAKISAGRKKSQASKPQQSSHAERDQLEVEVDPTDRAPRRRQTRTSEPSVASQEASNGPPKKRGRSSLTGADQTSSAKSQPALNSQRRLRSSINANEDEQKDEQSEAEPKPSKKKRGQPSKADSEATSSKAPPESSQTRKKKAAAPREQQNSVAKDTHQGKKRRRSSPEAEEEGIDQSTKIAHQRLVPREHKINRDIIDTKWNPLPPPALSRISTILNEAQRPVIHHLHPEQTRTQAQSVITAIIRKVERRLTKGFPFPPGTRVAHREEDFDLEKILKHNRNLEGQLTVLHHSNDLLIADRKKEEALLAKEGKMLQKLEASAKEEESFNKGEMKKSNHPLLKKAIFKDSRDEVTLAINSHVDLSHLQEDEELEPVIKQMHGHLDSMQGNMEQVKDIGPAITESKAAIEDVLFKHVDLAQYEHVVLGVS